MKLQATVALLIINLYCVKAQSWTFGECWRSDDCSGDGSIQQTESEEHFKEYGVYVTDCPSYRNEADFLQKVCKDADCPVAVDVAPEQCLRNGDGYDFYVLAV